MNRLSMRIDGRMIGFNGGNNAMRIGFVGTESMGTPTAGCLIRAVHSVAVYDRRPEAVSALCARGATQAESGFAAARDSEVVVFRSLPGPVEFEAAMLEPPGRGAGWAGAGGGAYRSNHKFVCRCRSRG
jgi:hypothetical protein